MKYQSVWKGNTVDTDIPTILPEKWSERLKILQTIKRRKREKIMKEFNAEKVTNDAIQWIKNWFEENGKNMSVVIGMSGGKDSTVTAALLCKAIGPERVYGVALPQGAQSINEADKICEYLGIHYMCVNIGGACAEIEESIFDGGMEIFSNNAILNIPPRVRMTTLYAIAQSIPEGAFVVNNCNLSEDYVGYATKFGDGAGDFSVLSDLTVTEILAIGDYLEIPSKWVHKTPDDGLPYSCPDEEKFGFSYAELDEFIRTGKEPEGHLHHCSIDGTVDDVVPKITKISRMHYGNLHKLRPMPKFNPYLPVVGFMVENS